MASVFSATVRMAPLERSTALLKSTRDLVESRKEWGLNGAGQVAGGKARQSFAELIDGLVAGW